MRLKKYEVTDLAGVRDILDRCQVLRLGLNDEGEVYILPMNFGYTLEGDTLTFYFHGATEGRKLDVLRKNHRVGFELDCDHGLKSAPGPCGHDYYYSSVLGNGTVTILDDPAEKAAALNLILAHHTGKDFQVAEKAAVLVSAYRLDVTGYSAKQHLPEE